MNDVQIGLLAARTLIADEACWTTMAQARDECGYRVWPSEPSAVAFCAIGAIVFAVPYDMWTPVEAALKEVALEVYDLPSPIYVNNHLGHEATLDMFDRAIELAGQP